MRNFYDQPVNKIFDKMFGKGARQIQADPTLDLTKCKCCQCDEIECKSCMEGHVITATAGCCHTANNGLIFEYERPNFYGNGMQCCKTPVGFSVPYYKKCCGTGKIAAGNVRFYYNYIGQYYNIDFNSTGKYSKWPKNGLPRLCSYCDPSSLEEGAEGNPAFGLGNETCLDKKMPALLDPRIDEAYPLEPSTFIDQYPCSSQSDLNVFVGCQCMGYGDLEDPAKTLSATTFNSKRLSKYRKRQMEQNEQYRWLLDIMCYDQGNVVASPYYEYILTGSGEGDDDVQAEARPIWNGGTLYNHLIGVVHCEHWYEIARCNQNPEHEDPDGILGGWIVDEQGNPIGANTSYISPRFWIYACSGVPLFDFEIERARRTLDENGEYFISEQDYQHIVQQLAQKRTPRQEVMLKLAKAGCFDIGDWRSEALNEIQVLKGLSYTAEAYGEIIGFSGDQGACCLGPSGDMSSSCIFTDSVSCGNSGGNFFLGRRCSSELCTSCSGFKPHKISNPLEKYLGPVRKKLYIPFNPPNQEFGINYRGITRPAFLDPRKARKNTIDDISPIPELARGRERDFAVRPDDTLINLQLPDDLLPLPWGDFNSQDFVANGGTFPVEPLPGETPSEEYLQFKTWLNSQWLYLHAKPGGWDYVCAGFQGDDSSEEHPYIEDPRIPNIPRKYSRTCNAIGCCLDGTKGWPQRSYQVDGGCPDDINCGEIDEDGNITQAEVIGCSPEFSCFGLDCTDDYVWCTSHPEQGGGGAPCRSLAYSSNCQGMRFSYYRHRQIGGSPATNNIEDYTTCSGSVNSYLYRVNLDSGNYGEFCPHYCRSLSVPKQIVDSLPIIRSNRIAAGSLCLQYRSEIFEGTMCDGLYCYNTRIPIQQDDDGNPIPPFYGPLGLNNQNECCGPRNNARRIDDDIPTNPIHPASNRQLCPVYPGPGCLTTNCRFYDGKFVGIPIDINPSGYCWKCRLEGSLPVPDVYLGTRTYNQCEGQQPSEIIKFDRNLSTGRGFIYPDQIRPQSSAGEIWAGKCACGTFSLPPLYPPPASNGEICRPPGLSGDDQTEGDGEY